MAKVVSAVPKLLTGGLIDTSPPPAPVVIQPPAPAPITTKTDTEATVDDAIIDPIGTRRRGRLGTIMTSFTGVLNDSNVNSQRRTLLGE